MANRTWDCDKCRRKVQTTESVGQWTRYVTCGYITAFSHSQHVVSSRATRGISGVVSGAHSTQPMEQLKRASGIHLRQPMTC